MDLARHLIEYVAEGVVAVAAEGRVLFANMTARSLLGGLDGVGWWSHHLRTPDGRPVPRAESPLARALQGETVSEVEMRVVRDDGSERVVLVRAHPLQGYGAAAYFRDVTEQRRRHSSELRRAVTTDPTTRLPNRDGFVRVLTELLAVGRDVAVLAVDLDGFSYVNNAYGHAAGDAVLLAVAQRIQRCVRPRDVVSRAYAMKGDEFLVLLSDVGDRGEVERVAARILEVVRSPIVVREARVDLTVSIGMALAQHGEPPEGLIDRADRAERSAKAAGKDRFRWAP